MRLPTSFFARDARIVARALIGTRLVHGGRVARIVETEAYRGPKDQACHARVGLTERTRALFGPPGTAYVFFVYGMHELFNIVCKERGSGHAALIRGVELVSGFDEGERGDGPGRLARAMRFTREDNGRRVWVEPRETRPRILVTARVGVGYAGAWADEPWRFLDPRSASVSKPPKRSIGRA